MRHHRAGKKLGRDASHRRALYANLTGSLIEHGRIRTTVTKAKAVRPIAAQRIMLGRRGDIHSRRQALAFLRSQDDGTLELRSSNVLVQIPGRLLLRCECERYVVVHHLGRQR